MSLEIHTQYRQSKIDMSWKRINCIWRIAWLPHPPAHSHRARWRNRHPTGSPASHWLRSGSVSGSDRRRFRSCEGCWEKPWNTLRFALLYTGWELFKLSIRGDRYWVSGGSEVRPLGQTGLSCFGGHSDSFGARPANVPGQEPDPAPPTHTCLEQAAIQNRIDVTW